MNKSLLFLINVDWFFVSHRLPIAIAAMKAGYKVHLACAFTDKRDYLTSLGISLHSLPISRSGTEIFGELKSFLAIFRLVRRLKPDIVHCVTIKPVLYGSIASRLAGIKGRVVSISGLGYVFVAYGLKAEIVRFLVSKFYRTALRGGKTKVIFQNPEDKRLFIKNRVISHQQAVILRGSGVTLKDYSFVPEPEGLPVITFASRLLKDKGVEEFVQAAQIIKERKIQARFLLIGDIDPDNPASVPLKMLDEWREKNIVEILGYRTDISMLFASSNIIALPSYREGLPKVLVEAAACGRAVVTTDVPGCRDAIEPGKTGVLVPVCDPVALADALQRLIENPELRQSMGRAGRQLAEREFAIEKIVDAHLNIYKQLLNEAAGYECA
jgi:glycosyltransferase involved in cell wall biosynthesis